MSFCRKINRLIYRTISILQINTWDKDLGERGVHYTGWECVLEGKGQEGNDVGEGSRLLYTLMFLLTISGRSRSVDGSDNTWVATQILVPDMEMVHILLLSHPP